MRVFQGHLNGSAGIPIPLMRRGAGGLLAGQCVGLDPTADRVLVGRVVLTEQLL